jgi:choline kinase
MQGWDLGSDYNAFVARWNGKKKRRVVTFAKKGFSIIHAMENIDCDRLIWIDADCIFQQKLNVDMLDSIANEETISTHFSVYHIKEEKKYHSCETGFFILNKNHFMFENFKNTYREIYVNDQTENLRRFYDGEVYGEVVNRLDGPWMNNLNKGDWKTPIKRSEVGKYVSHFKGKHLKDIKFKE